MPKWSEKEIRVEGHKIKLVAKGDQAGELGPELVERLKELDDQGSLEAFLKGGDGDV